LGDDIISNIGAVSPERAHRGDRRMIIENVALCAALEALSGDFAALYSG
jgi:hypothetical protein